ncbi:hypothetical protein [Adhaeretor mobilis]|uniref:Uncharacterized protein n=1 Tax=Adhaeretor mobilis TaxID=1930276 RepID=A0A517MQQ2_9BACT|nr:hypothetical protein [Adhaeretor mobilis]QDS97202.1 hypothetical protein HG15A2_04620 [Adhaeretor mobilis]
MRALRQLPSESLTDQLVRIIGENLTTLAVQPLASRQIRLRILVQAIIEESNSPSPLIAGDLTEPLLLPRQPMPSYLQD